MNIKTLLLVGIATIVLSGCSNFNVNNVSKLPATYMPTDLKNEFVDIIAEDIAKIVAAAYPQKTNKFKIATQERFGKTLGAELSKRGFAVETGFMAKFTNNETNTLPIGYKIDWLDRHQLYASVTVHVGYRLTRIYVVKGNTITALQGKVTGVNYGRSGS